MQLPSLRLSPFQWYRLTAIPLLALILLHFIFYQKLPFQAGYQFPSFTFILLIVMGLFICQCNYLTYRRLQLRRAARQSPSKIPILRHFLWGWIATLLIYSGLYFAQILFLNATFDHIRYGGFAILMLGISSLETSVLLLRDLFGFLQQRAARPVMQVLERRADDEGLINIPSGKQLIRLPVSELAFIISSGGLVTVHTISGQRIFTNFPNLDDLETMLDPVSCFRINRQYLVHRQTVVKIAEGKNRTLELSLKSGPEPTTLLHTSVSRYKAQDFRRWLESGLPVGGL